MYNAGLILEGGGMRGVYTAGVLDAFLDAGIEFSVYMEYLPEAAMHAATFLNREEGHFE